MKTKLILSQIVIGLVITSCQPKIVNLKPTYNNGGYTVSESKIAVGKVVITGTVKDITTQAALSSATIKLGCDIYQTDGSGAYQISVAPGVAQLFLSCRAIGYRSIETERFTLKEGDSVKIDFLLIQDDTPLINCEGTN